MFGTVTLLAVSAVISANSIQFYPSIELEMNDRTNIVLSSKYDPNARFFICNPEVGISMLTEDDKYKFTINTDIESFGKNLKLKGEYRNEK